jgi:hypothetical protein
MISPGVGCPSGQGAVNRDGEPKSIQGGDDLGLNILHRRNAHPRKNGVIFPGIHNHAEVIAMFDRQIGTIAGHDQALARIVAQNKSRERDRRPW